MTGEPARKQSMAQPHFVQLHQVDKPALAVEAAVGLLAPQAHASPKFFYDSLGSRLFDAITELAEYYPTRTEAAIMQAHGPAIVDAALRITGPAPALVDLGAGSCAKAAALFEGLQPSRYVAVDISTEYLRDVLARLQAAHPCIDMWGVGLDFSADLALPAAVVPGQALVFYPGSSIGNFAPDQALRLLQQARELAAGGALLIGVDRVKPVALLEPAYDDALGVTAAFNRNVLLHLNRLLGANFNLRQWRHKAFFNTQASRIEMHLEARVENRLRWPGAQRDFAEGERIHTENSYKWEPVQFEALLREAGFQAVQHWSDPQQWFSVFLASG
jgi:L-histidine Nalpha-methyltransferase